MKKLVSSNPDLSILLARMCFAYYLVRGFGTGETSFTRIHEMKNFLVRTMDPPVSTILRETTTRALIAMLIEDNVLTRSTTPSKYVITRENIRYFEYSIYPRLKKIATHLDFYKCAT